MHELLINLNRDSVKWFKYELKNVMGSISFYCHVFKVFQVKLLVENIKEQGPWRAYNLRIFDSHHYMVEHLLYCFYFYVIQVCISQILLKEDVYHTSQYIQNISYLGNILDRISVNLASSVTLINRRWTLSSSSIVVGIIFI